MAGQPPIPADAPGETVRDDPPRQARTPKVTHDPAGGRSSVNQRKHGGTEPDADAPDADPQA